MPADLSVGLVAPVHHHLGTAVADGFAGRDFLGSGDRAASGHVGLDDGILGAAQAHSRARHTALGIFQTLLEKSAQRH